MKYCVMYDSQVVGGARALAASAVAEVVALLQRAATEGDLNTEGGDEDESNGDDCLLQDNCTTENPGSRSTAPPGRNSK